MFIEGDFDEVLIPFCVVGVVGVTGSVSSIGDVGDVGDVVVAFGAIDVTCGVLIDSACVVVAGAVVAGAVVAVVAGAVVAGAVVAEISVYTVLKWQ